MIIQKEQKAMNWSIESTDDQTFISMFNALYKTVTCTHVSSSLNNELKNDCVLFCHELRAEWNQNEILITRF